MNNIYTQDPVTGFIWCECGMSYIEPKLISGQYRYVHCSHCMSTFDTSLVVGFKLMEVQ